MLGSARPHGPEPAGQPRRGGFVQVSGPDQPKFPDRLSVSVWGLGALTE